MRRSWTPAIVIFAGVVTVCAGGTGARREQAATHNVEDSRAAQNQGAKNGGAQGGSATKEPGQDAAGQQAKPSNTDQSSFLIARRALADPLFGKAVVLMLPLVDKDVVVGLIVNRPTKITLHELFPKIAAYKDGSAVAYFGGPVDVKTAGVLFRSTKEYKQAFHLTGDLYVTFNADVLEKVLKRPKDVSEVRLFLGRSQWAPEQLAGEMERGSWFGEKEANSVIFQHDSANVWIQLVGALEPEGMAEWEGGGAGTDRLPWQAKEGSFASPASAGKLRMTAFQK